MIGPPSARNTCITMHNSQKTPKGYIDTCFVREIVCEVDTLG